MFIKPDRHALGTSPPLVETGKPRLQACQCLRWCSLWPAIVLLLFWLQCCRTSAQTVPDVRFPLRVATFVSFTGVKPDRNYFTDYAIYGFSAGGYVQTRHLVGAELRGSVTSWGGRAHQESVLAGPRFALHWHRMTPYADLLGGEAHALIISPGPGRPITDKSGLDWSVLGGVDVYWARHWYLRAGEVQYSSIYTSEHNLRPFAGSVGLVYRLR